MTIERKAVDGGQGDPGIGPLINKLGPINNACRAAEGISKVELLWDLGEAVLTAYPEAGDRVLWAIRTRSYITRDLLRYALIVRRGWGYRAELRATFPMLMHYTVFREALPFLKGDRCGIRDDVYRNIVALLNSVGKPSEIKEYLLSLKEIEIGRRHHKGGAKLRMAPVAESVRAAVKAALVTAMAGGEAVVEVRRRLGDLWLLRLAQWCMAVASDSSFDPPEDGSGLPDPYGSLAAALARMGTASREDRAGFRKAVGVTTLMDGADLFHALRSDGKLEQWLARRAIRLKL